MTRKADDYISPPSDRGTRWNWYKSEMVRFPDGSSEMAHRHPNGSGWVADSCNVALSVYVHPLACVYKNAVVKGDVELFQFAQIFDGATVFGNVKMSVNSAGLPWQGYTKIYGPGHVYGNVVLLGNDIDTLGRNEINAAGIKVFGDLVVAGGSVVTGTDSLGNYTFSPSAPADTSFPSPPQAHGNFNPITRTNLNLLAAGSSLAQEDFSDINRLNARDQAPGSPVFAIPAIDVDQDIELEDPDEIGTTEQAPSSIANPEDSCDEDLAKLIYSDTAIRLGLDNTPDAEQEENLRYTCQRIIQPIKRRFGNVQINSSFRSTAVNAEVGGASRSQHLTGQACDIEVPGMSNLDLARWVQTNLEFDQLLLENHVRSNPNSGWVHVSIKKEGGNRRQVLTIYTSPYSSTTGLNPRG